MVRVCASYHKVAGSSPAEGILLSRLYHVTQESQCNGCSIVNVPRAFSCAYFSLCVFFSACTHVPSRLLLPSELELSFAQSPRTSQTPIVCLLNRDCPLRFSPFAIIISQNASFDLNQFAKQGGRNYASTKISQKEFWSYVA